MVGRLLAGAGDMSEHAAERAQMIGHADEYVGPALRIGNRPVDQIEQLGFNGMPPVCSNRSVIHTDEAVRLKSVHEVARLLF